MVIARLLGIKSFGEFASATALINVAFLFGPAGVDQLMLFHQLLVVEARRLMLVVCGLTAAATGFMAAFWPGISSATRMCAALLGVAALSRLALTPWFVTPQRQLNFRKRAARDLSTSAIVNTAILGSAFISRSAVQVAFASALAWTAVFVFVNCVRDQRESDQPSRRLRELRSMMRRSLEYTLSAAAYTIYYTVDGAILAALRPAEDVARYRVATLFVSFAIVPAQVVNNEILRARLARAREVGNSTQRPLLRKFGGGAVVMGAASSFIVYLLARLAVVVVYGSQYQDSVGLLQILSASLLPYYVGSFLSNVFISSGRVRQVVAVQLFLLTINVTSNAILVGPYGPAAAAWLTVATDVVGVGLYLALHTFRRGVLRNQV